MATIKDVAEKAGVSKTTVSRVLNGQGNFSAETIARIHRVMDELNYHPNEIARTLGKRESKMLALIVPNQEIPVFGMYTAAVEQAAYKRGYRITLCSSFYDSEEEMKSIQLLKNNMVDGIIYGGFNRDSSHFQNIDLPITTIGRQVSPEIPAVMADNHMAGQLAASHLYSKGCKHILYITGYPAGKEYDEKFKGISEVLNAAECQCHVYELSMDMQVHDGINAVICKALLEHPEADGIIAETDIIAMTAIQVCSSLGKKIPSDMKIVGYGNYFFSKLSSPSLTTVGEPIEQIATCAVEALISLIHQEKDLKHTTVIPVSLVERKTT